MNPGDQVKVFYFENMPTGRKLKVRNAKIVTYRPDWTSVQYEDGSIHSAKTEDVYRAPVHA